MTFWRKVVRRSRLPLTNHTTGKFLLLSLSLILSLILPIFLRKYQECHQRAIHILTNVLTVSLHI